MCIEVVMFYKSRVNAINGLKVRNCMEGVRVSSELPRCSKSLLKIWKE